MTNTSDLQSNEISTPVLLQEIIPIHFSDQLQNIVSRTNYIRKIVIPSELHLEFELYINEILAATSVGGILDCFCIPDQWTHYGRAWIDVSLETSKAKKSSLFNIHPGIRICENMTIRLFIPDKTQHICEDPQSIPLTFEYYNIWQTKYTEPFGLIGRWAFS